MWVALKQFVVIYKQFINNKKYNIKLGDVFLKDILFECFFSQLIDEDNFRFVKFSFDHKHFWCFKPPHTKQMNST